MPEPKAKGKGIGKKVGGIPVWVWGLALVGGLLVGVYLRRGGSGQATTSTTTAAPVDTSGLGDLSGVATTPSANGLGSATTDGSAATDTSGFATSLDNLTALIQTLAQNAQDQANGATMPMFGGNLVTDPAFLRTPHTGGALTTTGGIFVTHPKGLGFLHAHARTQKSPAHPVGVGKVSTVRR